VPDEDGPDVARVASDDDDEYADGNPRETRVRDREQEREAEPETALGVIWSVIAQDADDTIQEGKRFWGQLMRTVGAAAGGTVPDEPARDARDARDKRGRERASAAASRPKEAKSESVRDKLESNL